MAVLGGQHVTRLLLAFTAALAFLGLVMGQASATHDNSRVGLTLSPQNDTNTVGEPHCVTGTVRDRGHTDQSPVGVQVVFSVSGANPTPTNVVVVTNDDGQATFCYTGTKAGTDTITAFADTNRSGTQDNREPDASAKKTYSPGPPTKVTLEPAVATNPVGQQHCVTATVEDQFGNKISGARVVFSITGVNPTSSAAVRTTTTSGTAEFCYTGQNAGVDTIRAFVDRNNNTTLDAGEPVTTATKTYLAPGPTTLTLAPPADTNRAGEQHCVTATATNALGGPISGVPIVFRVTGANTAGGTVTTNASGQAEFCYTGQNVGLDVITAYADADKDNQQDATELVATATKTYLPGAPATVTLKPPTSENTVGTQHCVTATVKDEFGNPTPNETVVFTVTGANPATASVKTDQNGNAVFCYTGQRSGLDTIRAFVDTDGDETQDAGEPAGGPVTKLYHPGVPRTVTLEPKFDDNVVGEEHCVTATAHDEFGNRVGAGHPIVFEVTGANEAGPTTVMTNASGQARFCYTGTKAGEDVITAFADNDGDQELDPDEVPGAATKTYLPGPPANLVLSPETDTNRAGERHCVTATVTDRFGNPVAPGHPIRFSVSGANPTAEDVVVVTNTEGKAEFCYTGTKAGTDTITAFADNNANATLNEGEPSDTATKTYRPGPPAKVTVTPATDENVVGDQHCVTATVEDRFGNRVEAGTKVFFTVTGANAATGTDVTTANGQATFCYTGTKAGVDTIRAVADANENGQLDTTDQAVFGLAEKTYLPGPPAKIELAPEQDTNRAGERHCVTATVTDRFGNPVGPGHPIRFSVSGANPTAEDVVVATNAEGKAEFCYIGTKAGTDTITAFFDANANTNLDQGEPSDTATKVYRPGPPATVDLAPKADENTVGEEHCVTATVKDEFGNLVEAGTAVFFSVTGVNPTAAPVKKTTDANGQAIFCYTGTKAGLDTIRAVADANENGQLDTTDQLVFGVAEKTYLPGPPAKLELSPKTATNEVGEEHCVTATVMDRFGNPTPGITVVFSVTGAVVIEDGEAQVGAGGSVETNGQGEAEFCYTSELPGENLITAFADTNENGRQDTDEPFDTATKTYLVPTTTPLCEISIHDGGWIVASNGDRGTFGGNAQADANGQITKGSQEYTDHGPAADMNVKSTELLAVFCEGNRATIYGTARVQSGTLTSASGTFPFRVRVVDSGEPGRADTYGILVGNGYWSSDERPLQGGNVQIRIG
jgi:uncharacterized protein (DUF2141 family)